MEKVIIFINKEIIVQQYTLFRYVTPASPPIATPLPKMTIFLLYMYNEKFLSSPYGRNKP